MEGISFEKTKLLTSKYVKSAIYSLAVVGGSASAFELEFDDSDMTGFVDTTITASVAMSIKNIQPLNATPSGRGVIFDSSGDV